MDVIKINQSIALALCILSLPILVGCNQLITGDSYVNRAMVKYDDRDFSGAIPLLEKALNKPLNDYSKSTVLTMIGNCYNELDQFEKSLEYHDQAIKEDPKNHQAYVNKGVVHRLMGDYNDAKKMYLKALELQPDYPELHASMGALAIFQGDTKTAIKHLERSVELDDSLPVTHSNLALAYAVDGRFDKADAELKKAVIRGYHQPEVIKERIDQLRSISEPEK